MSLAVVFEYEVDPAGAAAFEAVYGGDGEWARFFAGAEGYLGTSVVWGEVLASAVFERASATGRSRATSTRTPAPSA
jgi:hypothetical protein